MNEENPPAETPTSFKPDPAAARKEMFRALVLCLIAVIFVRSFVFELFKIPSSSMVPTLKIGDHIVVSKFNYGLTFPFSAWELVRWGSPRRGDVIVFIHPKDESLYFIKRVIGLPGDKVEVRGKQLIVNDAPVEKVEITAPEELQAIFGNEPTSGKIYRETISGVSHLTKYSSTAAYDFPRSEQPYVVADDHFFVLGDNRDDSYDSRSWGDVPRGHIRGKAQMIWISLERNVSWVSFSKIRWSRVFTRIH